jgi:hypothetical protein
MLPSPEGFSHESSVWFDAETRAGVRFRLARISIARRIVLARRIREIARKVEFLEAGLDAREKLEAVVLAAEIDRVYLEWGLEEIRGLDIDGDAATPAALIEKGPMDVAKEILARIKRECGLSENQRKN